MSNVEFRCSPAKHGRTAASTGHLERLCGKTAGPWFCGERLTTADVSFYVMAAGLIDGTYCEGLQVASLGGCSCVRVCVCV